MSAELAAKWPSLQYTEQEVEEATPKINMNDPEVQRIAATFTEEQKQDIIGRESIIGRLVSKKFENKVYARGLGEDWGNQVILPSTLGPDRKDLDVTGVAFLEQRAPDLVEEFKAHQEWLRLRQAESKASKDTITTTTTTNES